MPEPIGQNTTVSLGLLATAGGFIIGGMKWLIGIKKDVDNHTEQLKAIEQKIKEGSELHTEIRETLNDQADRMARMETKIDLLIQDKIK